MSGGGAERRLGDGTGLGPPVHRPTVRVLLLDAADRLLLLRNVDESGAGFWCPAGGGIEPGETAEAAARRELHEETGLRDAVLGPVVGHRRSVVSWDGVAYDCHEVWFVVRVISHVVDVSGFTEEERAEITDLRWWTPAELARADERLVPRDLAALVQRLITDGPPDLPLALGP